MSEKHDLRTMHQTVNYADQSGFKTTLPWLVTLITFGCIWTAITLFHVGQFSFGMLTAITFILCGVLTVSLEKSFKVFRISKEWRFRTAFLTASVSVGISFILWGFFLTHLSNRVAENVPLIKLMLMIVVPITGAFTGGLAATAVEDNLWENNSPPSEQIETSVLQMHLKTIGIPGPEPKTKRAFDYVLAISAIVISFPVWMFITIIIWVERPGPILFIKNSVTKGGHNFRQFKFRTMTPGAELETGPVLSQEGDNRVLNFGRILRKTALDELPQLINILTGEMSFVGPRPQRTILVDGYLQVLPEYAQSHEVLPGLSGLAQVAGDYYLTPRQKLRLDLLYIRYRGLGFDIKLLLLAFLIAFYYRWQKRWDGRLPRRLLRFGS